MKNIHDYLNESISSKEEKEIKKLGFIKDKEGKEVWFELETLSVPVQVLQEEPGDDSWWIVRINHQYIENADGEPMTFESPLEACQECLDYIEQNNIK